MFSTSYCYSIPSADYNLFSTFRRGQWRACWEVWCLEERRHNGATCTKPTVHSTWQAHCWPLPHQRPYQRNDLQGLAQPHVVCQNASKPALRHSLASKDDILTVPELAAASIKIGLAC